MNIYQQLCSCINCHKEYSHKGIFTHYERSHGDEKTKQKYKSGFTESDLSKTAVKSILRKQNLISEYLKSPNYCRHCSKQLSFEQRKQNFCNNSCSASYNNKLQIKTAEQKQKIGESVRRYKENVRKEKEEFRENFVGPIFQKSNKKSNKKTKNEPEFVGPFTKIYFCKCKFCIKSFVKTSVKQICDDCKSNQRKLYVDYRFTFNVYHYPNLFDLKLLGRVGWYSPKGKSGKWNPNGLSRDHKVSVSESVKNNYDPFYITHPLNCELMPHSENSKKKQKSSLSYSELVALVDAYENGVGR